jgi:hypothetical protein
MLVCSSSIGINFNVLLRLIWAQVSSRSHLAQRIGHYLFFGAAPRGQPRIDGALA